MLLLLEGDEPLADGFDDAVVAVEVLAVVLLLLLSLSLLLLEPERRDRQKGGMADM